MNYPLFIARRISLSSGGRKKAPAVAVAIAAVALSVVVMMSSIAIVLGFKQEIRDKVVGFNSHITVYPASPGDDNIVTLSPALAGILEDFPFVTGYHLQAAIPAVLKTDSDFKGVYLKGLADGDASAFISANLEEGEVPDFKLEENASRIVVSRTAARQLGLNVGDRIDTYFISDDVRVRRLEVAGIFNSHFDQYDDVLIFGDIKLVQKLGQIGSDQGTYIQLTVDDFDRIPEYSSGIQERLYKAYGDDKVDKLYRTEHVLSQGAGFFNWLALLDTNVVVVLAMMMTVGCVTLISGMLIIIIEKKRFIGIMKSMGSPTSDVRKVFVYLALKICLHGLLIGNIVGLALLKVQEMTHFIPLDADSYYIDFVPVRLSWESVLALNVGVLVVTYLVLILPSRFVAKISPSESMRSE